MKKLIAVFLSILMVLSFSLTPFAEDEENAKGSDTQKIITLAESHASINGDLKEYDIFEVDGKEIRLYPETLVTAEKALEMYPNAYKMCAEMAAEYKLSTSLDNREFQEFAKIHAAMNENGSEDFIAECIAFATFLDYYENAKLNEELLSLVAVKDHNATDELNALMPHYRASTLPMNDIDEKEDANAPSQTKDAIYDTAAVVQYANSWWNKTNNSSYSYYASYYGYSTNTNSYNDLDPGRSGQSSTRRGWSDCADFVSQCLAAGGVPQIKTGLISPHSKTSNWYYSDSKPSHTWGGANNFYNHWSDRVGVASSSSALGVGDAVSIDFGGDGTPDHTVIIVQAGSTDSSKYLASHTYDRYKKYYSNGNLYDYTISYLYGKGWTLYGYEIDTVF